MSSERVIQAGDREVRVLFNNRALAEAEQAMNLPVTQWNEGMGVIAVAQLLRAGMESARRAARTPGRPVSLNEAYRVMDAAGFAPVTTAVMEAVAEVLSYRNDEGDEDADADPN